MTATRVELTNPGDSLTMQVTECRPATTGNFPGIEFIGMDGARLVVVEIPTATTQRQLERLKLSSSQLVGKILTLSRSVKLAANQKPFWNIDVVGQVAAGATIAPAPKAQEIPLPPPPEDAAFREPVVTNTTPANLTALFNLHTACFNHVMGLSSKTGWDLTPEAISALTAQVFIAANERGIR